MAKMLKATILMISEMPDQPGVGRAVAKYILGDDTDASINLFKFKELAAPDLGQPTTTLYAGVVAAIKADEWIP